jgi:ribose 5-phosphate isomerase A
VRQARAAGVAASSPAAAAPAELKGIDKAKQLAGYKAVDDHVKSGMVVGLGTGSTAAFAVERVGQKLKSGELQNIICIPTSVATENQAKGLGIPLCTLNEKSRLDVAIDGADAVDPNLALVKGGGGALLREKMVEVMADKFICIVDDSKLCKGLGPSFALPVEITPFCHEHTLRTVAALPEVAGCTATLRMGKVSTGAKKDGDNIAVTGSCPPHRLHPSAIILFHPYASDDLFHTCLCIHSLATDNGNYIVDLAFKEFIKDVPAAAKALKNVVGVVDHGLFVGMTYQCIVATPAGTTRVVGQGGEKCWW